MTPAPDGRGAAGQQRPPAPSRSRWWIAAGIVVFLLAINLWVSSQALKPNAPIRIPYSPTVPRPGPGQERQARSPPPGTRSPGRSRRRSPTPRAAPPSRRTSPPRSRRSPTTRRCSRRCASEGVTINAQPTNKGPSIAESLIFGFGPTLLLVALFVFIARRSAGGRRRRRGPDVLRPLAGAARRGLRSAHHLRGRRRDRRGQGGADRDRRLPQDARQVPRAGRAHPARRAAVRAARAPARRCWRAPWPGRPGCRSSRCRPRSSSR